jgi:hypothetical protein
VNFGYADLPNGKLAPPKTSYINAVAVDINGLVTQVSFYAAHSCNDHHIYFGAFSALTSISSSTEFSLTQSSNALSVVRTSDRDKSMKLVTISLCVDSTSIDCQGQAFQINVGQYFGSYTRQCNIGFTLTSSSDYPSTYSQHSSNPYAPGSSPKAYYSNGFPIVVLQYIEILSKTTGNTNYLILKNSSIYSFFSFRRSMHLTKSKYNTSSFTIVYNM